MHIRLQLQQHARRVAAGMDFHHALSRLRLREIRIRKARTQSNDPSAQTHTNKH